MNRAWAALAGLLLGGCGTIRNFASGDPEIYGGASKDFEVLTAPCSPGGKQTGEKDGAALLLLADFSASLVADTLTLPLAVYLRQNSSPGEETPVPARGRVNPVSSAGPLAGAASLGKPCPTSQAPQPATPAGIGRPMAEPSVAPDSQAAGAPPGK
jgi:uncharacterized protein YceK